VNRIIKYEIIRARTLKSTWIFPLIGIALSWIAAYFATSNAGIESMSSEGGATFFTFAAIINNSFTPLSIFFITIPFAQAFGHEYRDGTMRLTLSAYPIRIKVFVAKTLVPTVISVIAVLIAMLGMRVIYSLRVRVPFSSSGNESALELRHLIFTVLWGLIVAAVVIFTRNMAAGIAGVVVWAAILENLVVGLFSTKWEKIGDYLPLLQGMNWTQNGESRSLAVIAITTAVMVVLSAAKFLKRDA